MYYDAFGLSSLSQGTQPSPFGFVGGAGYQSGDAGLMLFGNRYYAAGIGRFLSSDPAKAGNNWYDYCGNAPLGGIDPTGLSADPAHYTTQFETITGLVESGNRGDELGGSAVNIIAQQKMINEYREAAIAKAFVEYGGSFYQTGPMFPAPDSSKELGEGITKQIDDNFDFDFTRNDWNDIFTSQADFGKWETSMRFNTFRRVHRAFLGSIGFALIGLCANYQKVESPIGSNFLFANMGAMIGLGFFIYGFFWPPTEH